MTSDFPETQQKPDLAASGVRDGGRKRSQATWQISQRSDWVENCWWKKVDGRDLNTSRENKSLREEVLGLSQDHLLSHSSKHLNISQTICPEWGSSLTGITQKVLSLACRYLYILAILGMADLQNVQKYGTFSAAKRKPYKRNPFLLSRRQ